MLGHIKSMALCGHDFQDYGTPAKLMEAVRAIANNQTEYERRIAWKKRSWNELQPSFLAFTQRTHVHQPHTRCQVRGKATSRPAGPQAWARACATSTSMHTFCMRSATGQVAERMG